MLTLFFSVFNYLCSKAQCAQNMDIVNWMIKSNTHREHWWRKLLFHLWILLFLLQMTEVIRKSDFVGIRLSSIRSDTVCLVIFMLSHSAGARRRTGFGGLGCLCCWQEQVKEQTEILLWAPCVMCSSTGQNYGFFFLFVDFLNAWKVIHSFLHLLVAQYDLWFLLIQFLWMWDLLAPCLRDHMHTLDMLLVLETLTIFVCSIYSMKWRSKKTILTNPRFDGILFYELLTSIFPPPSLL